MHGEVLDWLGTVRAALPALFRGRRVLECGSYDVNGSARSLFEDCEYVGLDWRPGPGVDVVGLVHEYEPERLYDVVVSTEMLEHDPHWKLSLARMCQVLRPGGALLLTWAGPARPSHALETAPEAGYYRGLLPADVATVVTPFFEMTQARFGRGGLDCWLLALGRATDFGSG